MLVRTLITCILLLGLTGPGFSRSYADDRQPTFEGYWSLDSVTRDEDTQELSTEQIVLTVKGNSLIYGSAVVGKLHIGTGTNPVSIDLTMTDAKGPIEGLLALEAESARICWQWEETTVKERPVDFTTKGRPGRRLLTLKRVTDVPPGTEPAARGFVGLALRRNDDGTIAVANTLAESPARKAGIKADDVLLKVAGVPATDVEQTVAQIRRAKPNSELLLDLNRGQQAQTVRVKVGTFPFRLLID
ncbi:MAG: PDZ domain-containing protein [Planctomycetes bacterium]|nr:PDZ domain-containing protein [Planctomycetota bacterium]